MADRTASKIGVIKALGVFWKLIDSIRGLANLEGEELNAANLRARAAPMIEVADMIADITQTDFDDKLVDYMQTALSNDEIVDVLVIVLRKVVALSAKAPINIGEPPKLTSAMVLDAMRETVAERT